MRIYDVARIAHEINMAYCKAIGDNSQVPWEEAPDWQRVSAINGVTYHLENSMADPEESHINWYNEKHADGWVYGEVKNAELKQHPCMLPFSELPVDQKAKDYIFRQVVHSLQGHIA